MIRELRHQSIEPNTIQQARLLDVSPNFIYHNRRRNELSPIKADRLAIHLGYHPSLVWGQDWWDSAEYDMARSTELRRARNERHQAKCV